MKNQWFVFTSLDNPKETKTASPFWIILPGIPKDVGLQSIKMASSITMKTATRASVIPIVF